MLKLIASVFLPLILCSNGVHAQCSPQLLKGQYVFAGRGYIEPGEPGIERVHRGIRTFDGNGNVSGKQSSSRAGKIGREKPQGTYTLESDCSGTMTFGTVANPGGQVHWGFYVTHDGRLGHMIRTDPGSMAVRTFER